MRKTSVPLFEAFNNCRAAHGTASAAGSLSARLKAYFNAVCRVNEPRLRHAAEFLLRGGILTGLLLWRGEHQTGTGSGTDMVCRIWRATLFIVLRGSHSAVLSGSGKLAAERVCVCGGSGWQFLWQWAAV